MDLGTLNEETTAWVEFGDDGEILLKYISQTELDSIIKKATKTVWANHQKTAELDNIKANRLLGRAAVKDWRNLTSEGKPFPYSPENCDLLMDQSWNFSLAVNDACTDMRNFVKKQQEESKKN